MLRILTGIPALGKFLFLHNKALFSMSFKYTTVMQLKPSVLLWRNSVADNKELPAIGETWVWSLGWEEPLEKRTATHFCTLAWRIHGQKSLAVYSPRDGKESDTTEWLSLSRFFRDSLEAKKSLFCCCLITLSCLTLCNPTDNSPSGPSIPGIFQARILEGVAISFSRGCSWG